MKRFLPILSFLSLLSIGCFAQEKINPAKLIDFENYLTTEIDSGKIAGIEVLIHHKEKTVWHKALGYNNLIDNRPLEKNSIYFIQSMTKPIMSVAIMQLVEQGLLSLNDKVADFIPAVSTLRVIKDVNTGIDGATVPVKSPMTIKQLLTHTAGLSHGLEEHLFDQQLFKLMYNDLFDPAIYNKLEEPVEKLLQVPLIGQPGEQWYYSAAPDLLALILQKITQQPINEYLEEHIFSPLGMQDTGYNISPENLERIMQLHFNQEDGTLVTSHVQAKSSGNTVYGGTYGLFSSTEDYLKFCQMILNKGAYDGGQILAPETVVEMTKNHVGALIGPTRGLVLGLAFYTILKMTLVLQIMVRFIGVVFLRHIFLSTPKADLIALIMTQKIPNTNEYIIALNRAVYGALEK